MFSKKAIFINTASQIIVRFVTLAFALISVKLLTNYLGPNGVGEFNSIVTYINLFVVLADLGLFAVTVREIAKNPDNEGKILSNVFTIRLISAAAACLVAIGVVNLTSYSANIKLGVLIASGFLFFNLMASVYDMVLQYRLKMQYSAIAEFIAKLINILALYVIIRLHGSFLWIAATIALWGVLIFIFKWIFASKFVKINPTYDKKVTSWIFQLAWPLGLVFIVSNLYFKLDTLMLFVMKGATAVGIYSVAFKILEVTAFVGAFFAGSLKPTLSENIENNKPRIGDIVGKSISIMIYLALPISLICTIFSKEIILFISNADFLSGSNALVLLAFALPFIYLDTLLIEVLVANDSRRTMIGIAIFILLFNFSTNLYFIPRYSFMGSSFTTLLSEIVLFFVNLYFVRKIVKVNINLGQILKMVVVAILTLIGGFLLKALPFNFLILICATMLLFAALSYIFKLISYQSFKELTK